MTRQLDKDTQSKIREAVEKGRPRYDVAEIFKVDPKTVYKYTKDIPVQKHKKRTKITEQMRRKIRRTFKMGVLKYEIAKEMDVSDSAVGRATMDMPGGKGKYIRGRGATLLATLVNVGFYIPTSRDDASRTIKAYRALKERFPIQRIEIRRKSVYFLVDRRREAFRAYLQARKKKVIPYKEICEIRDQFGISKNQHKELKLGKSLSENNLTSKIKSKKRVLQTTVSDYFGRFLHSELLLN